MDPKKLDALDKKINKSFNVRIFTLLEIIKVTVQFYLQSKYKSGELAFDFITKIRNKTIRERKLTNILECLIEQIKQANTFYLYLRKKNFGSQNFQEKSRQVQDFVRRRVAFSEEFPLEKMIKIVENENYTLGEILGDRRKFEIETYFVKGRVLIRNGREVQFSEQDLEHVFEFQSFVYEICS